MTATGEKLILFVVGAPRSGTTAMIEVLNAHSQVIMLGERYANLALHERTLAPEHFEEKRLFEFREGDSFYNAVSPQTGWDRLRPRYPGAVYVGDKVPRLYEQYDLLARNFPAATILFMSRNVFDVAASYNRRARDPGDNLWPANQDFRAAVQDWNRAHRETLDAAGRHRSLRFIGIDYERLYFDPSAARLLFSLLEIPNASQVNERALEGVYRGAQGLEQKRGDPLSSGEKRFLCLGADLESYRDLHATGDWIS